MAGPREMLVSKGLRCTLQRERIFAALASSNAHPTAEQLLTMVNACGESPISLATIYNTLEAFTASGLCRKIAPTSGGTAGACRYDADTTNHAHIMLADGSIRDLPDDLAQQVVDSIPAELVRRVELALGIKIARFSIEFVENSAQQAGQQAARP